MFRQDYISKIILTPKSRLWGGTTPPSLIAVLQKVALSVRQGLNLGLKVPGPISQNEDFYWNDAPPPKKSWFQISVQLVKRFGYGKRICILQLPITLLCKPNYGIP